MPTKALHELLATISKKYVAEDPQLEFKVLVMLLKYYFAIQMATHLHTVKKHFFFPLSIKPPTANTNTKHQASSSSLTAAIKWGRNRLPPGHLL